MHIVVHASDASVMIEVRDDGPGIPAELATRIFDPFFTTKPNTRGVGLGLSIAEGLVRGAGGRLTLASTGGDAAPKGASFQIELPRASAESEARAGDGASHDDGAIATRSAERPRGVA